MKFKSKRPKLEILQEIGRRINGVRKMFKESQDEFVKRVGITRVILSKMELGKQSPGFTFLYNLFNEGISVDYLITGQGKVFNNERHKDQWIDQLQDDDRMAIDYFINSPFVRSEIKSKLHRLLATDSEIVDLDLKKNQKYKFSKTE